MRESKQIARIHELTILRELINVTIVGELEEVKIFAVEERYDGRYVAGWYMDENEVQVKKCNGRCNKWKRTSEQYWICTPCQVQREQDLALDKLRHEADKKFTKRIQDILREIRKENKEWQIRKVRDMDAFYIELPNESCLDIKTHSRIKFIQDVLLSNNMKIQGIYRHHRHGDYFKLYKVVIKDHNPFLKEFFKEII